MESLYLLVVLAFVLLSFVGIPVALTIVNLLAFSFTTLDKPLKNPFFSVSEVLTFFFGILYAGIMLSSSYGLDFDISIVESTISIGDAWHTPIATAHYPTILIFFAVGVSAYILLKIYRLKLPPLILILLFSCLLIGTTDCFVFIIQTSNHLDYLLPLFPFNFIVLSIVLLIQLVREYSNNYYTEQPFNNTFLQKISKMVQNSRKWPLYVILFSLPILICIILVLILFGQQPDSFVKAFADTADWALSQKLPAPNISTEGHYLCTVSLKGHPSIVKPLRLGVRHGQKIVVNRQLLVANAFEQLIQDRFPRVHRLIRTNYDKYGYPLSRHIHTPRSADIVYILMKPLEWFFTLTLYTFDRHPETRIAEQYLPKEKETKN